MGQSKYSDVDEYGFTRSQEFNYESYDKYMSEYLKILTRRSQRWNSLKGPNIYQRSSQMKRFVRKGIPNEHRCQAWMVYSGALEMQQSSQLSYSQIRKKMNNRHIIETIQLDLPRTFPDNIYFKSQESLQTQLFNVLVAFASQNAEVGYCQGLNYIAGLLLLATKSEEASFWILKALVERILPPYYVSSMSGLLTDLDVLDELVKKSDLPVHRHVHLIGMPWAMGVPKWFICLYGEILPTETVFRIWDCLFYEGDKIIYRVALTLIRMHRMEILKTRELHELINCFRNMRNNERVINCHEFMANVFKLSGNLSNSTLEKMRRKYKR